MRNGKIRFVSTLKGLDLIDECRPKPAKNFIPKWFKDIPSNAARTVKGCPSFPDFFSQGYVLPMWADVELTYISDQDRWTYATPTKDSIWDVHGPNQFTDFVKPSFFGVDGQYVFKGLCPWRIITPPGWSVLQLPLFYHFNQEWSVLPGIIDTDIYHEINQQILYHGKDKTILINAGDPLAVYIPFKRSDKLELDVSSASEKDMEKFNQVMLNFTRKFSASGVYRKLQRSRDKK